MKGELFVTTVHSSTLVTKSSILDVAGDPDPPLQSLRLI